MARSATTANDINRLAEPLVIILNGAFYGVIAIAWFFAMANICYAVS